MAVGNLKIENYVPYVKFNKGIRSSLDVTIASGATVTLPSTTTIGGSSVSALGVITSTSANALTAGRQGATGPAFNVDASTASQADGLNVKGLAAGNGVGVSAITTGTNSPITFDAAGSGIVKIAGTSTGDIQVGAGGGLLDVRATEAADGSGSTATLLKVGNTGRPQTTAQDGWLPIKVGGVAAWIPVWK